MTLKAEAELNYWLGVQQKEKSETLNNSHYESFYTTHFNLSKSFYIDKKVLDIGCGPRGSLEWCDIATQRIGLDPLAKSYSRLGIHLHKMLYVACGAENTPFPDEYFDIVTSFNSLDHVDNVEVSILEIIRILKPAGLFLLITDVNHKPTATEPINFSWNIVEKFTPQMTILEQKHFEKGQKGIYQSITDAVSYNHANMTQRYGVLTAKFQKRF